MSSAGNGSGKRDRWAKASSMATIQVWTGIIPTPPANTLGPVLHNGIVDRFGNPITGKIAFFQSGDTVLNTLMYQDALNNAFVTDVGADTGLDRYSWGVGDIGRFGIKICATGGGQTASQIDYQSDLFFAGNFQGAAAVPTVLDFGPGSMLLNYTINDVNRGNRSVMATVIDGDFDLVYGGGTLAGDYATPSPAKALLNVASFMGMGHTTGLVTGAGGFSTGYGWDTYRNQRAVIAASITNQGGNARGQALDRMAGVPGGGAWANGPVYVSAWNPLSYTITGPSTLSYNRFAFCGDLLDANAGEFLMPADAGAVQDIDLGINAAWVIFSSCGLGDTDLPTTDRCELTMGWTDGTRQAAFWGGETSGNVNPIKGARYLTNGSLGVFSTAGANAASTQINARFSFVNLDPGGNCRIVWPQVDGVERRVQWLAIGTRTIVPPPAVPTSNPICLVPLPAPVLVR